MALLLTACVAVVPGLGRAGSSPPLHPTASVSVKNVVLGLAPAGRGVAYITSVYDQDRGYWPCGATVVWTPGATARPSLPPGCATENLVDAWNEWTLAATNGLVAWTNCAVTMSVDCRMRAGTPGGHAVQLLRGSDQSIDDMGVFGDATVVTYAARSGQPVVISRIVSGARPRLVAIQTLPADSNIVAAAKKIAVIRHGYGSTNKTSTVDLATGAIEALPLRLGRDDQVHFDGLLLAVQRRDAQDESGPRLDVYDTHTGALRFRAQLSGKHPLLQAIRGETVAYTAGPQLHLLRLGRGDSVVPLPGAAAALNARLNGQLQAEVTATFSPRGLFVAYPEQGLKTSRLLLFTNAATGTTG